jgi:hypothetical protein
MAITKEQLQEIAEEEIEKLMDGRKVLNIDRGNISITVMIENGKVSARIREKEIENERSKKQ